MKRLFASLVLVFCIVSAVDAQGDSFYRKYRNFSWSSMGMDFNGVRQHSDIGASFTSGRTYFLHGKPIAGMLKIGIDATWSDIAYSRYPGIRFNDGMPYGARWHQIEYSLHVGPSIALNPVGKLNINAYFRYAPTFSLRYSKGEGVALMGNYATMFVTGGMVSWGIIGIGAEYRFGDCNYRNFIGNEASPAGMSGFRAFVSLRFK